MSAAASISMMSRDYVDEKSKALVDLLYQATYIARMLRETAREWPGGPGANEYFVYQGAGGVGHKLGGSRWTNKDRDVAQQFRWQPTGLRIPIVTDLAVLRVLNAPSPYRILDELEVKISNAFLTAGSQMEATLFLPGIGSGNASFDWNINGFAEATSAGTTGDASFDGNKYNIYGELARTGYPWSKAIRGNVKALNNEISWKVLQDTYVAATVGGAQPTVGATTPITSNAIMAQFVAQQCYQQAVEPTFGYTGFKFNQAMIINSRLVPGREVLNDDTVTNFIVDSTANTSLPLTAYPLVAGSAGANATETFWWLNPADAYMHYMIQNDRIFGLGVTDFIPSAEHDLLVAALRLAYMFCVPGPRYQYQINQILVN